MTDRISEAEDTYPLAFSILNQIPTPTLAIDPDFNLIFVNKAACTWIGKEKKDIQGSKCYDHLFTTHCQTPECRVEQAMKNDRVFITTNKAKRGDKKVPIEYTAAPLKNDKGNIIGALEYIIDITGKVEAEAKIFKQQEDLLELSTPVISLWDSILALPLVGTLDSRRTQDAMEKSLTRMANEKARVLIVDITGVPAIDTMVANNLIRMATAVHLMGGHCILTGISPLTARTIVHLGINLSAVNTCSTLAQGLELGIKLVNSSKER